MEISIKRQERLKELSLDMDLIIQRTKRLRQINNQKLKEITWLQEVIRQEENKAASIKEEFESIARTKES